MRHSCLVHVRRCDMPLVCGFAAAPPVSPVVLEQSPWPLRVRCRHGECRYLHTIWRAGHVQVLCGYRKRPAAKHTTIQPTRSRAPGRAAHTGTISDVMTCNTIHHGTFKQQQTSSIPVVLVVEHLHHGSHAVGTGLQAIASRNCPRLHPP